MDSDCLSARITSYNVCYTKLLRHELVGERAVGHRRRLAQGLDLDHDLLFVLVLLVSLVEKVVVLDQFMGLEHVAIDTNNFDAEVNKIKAAGIKILEERNLPDGRRHLNAESAVNPRRPRATTARLE